MVKVQWRPPSHSCRKSCCLTSDCQTIDGWDVARVLREKLDLVQPVLIAVTCFGGQYDRLRSQEAGIDHHLTSRNSDRILCAFSCRSSGGNERRPTRPGGVTSTRHSQSLAW
jgi:hypothetical protein